MFSSILNLLGQHTPEFHCLLWETAISFTCLTLISYQFQRAPPPRSSAEFGEKHFQVHLIHDFSNVDYIFLSSKTSPNALLSASFPRTLWILWLPLHMDLMISKSHQQWLFPDSSVPVLSLVLCGQDLNYSFSLCIEHSHGNPQNIPFTTFTSTLQMWLSLILPGKAHRIPHCGSI